MLHVKNPHWSNIQSFTSLWTYHISWVSNVASYIKDFIGSCKYACFSFIYHIYLNAMDFYLENHLSHFLYFLLIFQLYKNPSVWVGTPSSSITLTPSIQSKPFITSFEPWHPYLNFHSEVYSKMYPTIEAWKESKDTLLLSHKKQQ